MKKNKDEENENDIIDCLGQNDNPSELIFETIIEDRGAVSRFSDNIIFDSSRGDEYVKYDPPKERMKANRVLNIQRKIGRIS